MAHKWRFYRAGGVDQVQITTGADLVALEELDQKLWVALSCPVKGLEFDERTLQLIDRDGDGRVRAPELLEAIRWTAGLLKDVEDLARGSSSLPLASIDTSTEEGKLLLETARSLLDALGKKDVSVIDDTDVTQAIEAFAKEPENGDGIVPLLAVSDDETKKDLTDVLSTIETPQLDRSGEPGVNADDVAAFFTAAREHLAWVDSGRDASVRILGEASDAALEAQLAVEAKIDDFFARTRVLAFDPRAFVASNGDEATYTALLEKELSSDASALVNHPIAHVEAGAALPLGDGVNPAWAERVAAFRDRVVEPLLGKKERLTSKEWSELKGRWAAAREWWGKKPNLRVEALGVERLRELTSGDAEVRLGEVIAADQAASDRAAAIESVEKLVRFHRDLMTLANNFVSFRDFYGGKKAIFQVGTLYIDQRSSELCLQVVDAGRHVTMAPLSRAYLLYCDLKNPEGQAMSIVAAITNGGVDNLMEGRNGLFYDRQGKDWDATVTRIVENPISVREAFWSPYKKLIRLVEEQVNKRAAAAQAEADAKLDAKAAQLDGATQGQVQAAPPPPKKIDIGVVAALGVAVGGITAALGMLLDAFFGLGFWMPLGILGLLLVISGPSMAIAWLKLRQRNIGPLLDANGWAVNVLTKVNVPLGKSLTQVATLPRGSSRDLVDPFAEKKKPWWVLVLLATVVSLGIAWYLGKLDGRLPEKYQSVTVLGDAAPAKVQVQPAPEGEPAPAP